MWYVPPEPRGIILNEVAEFVGKLFDMLCSDTYVDIGRTSYRVSTDPNTGVRTTSYPEKWEFSVTHMDTYASVDMSCGLFWEVFPVAISKACDGESYLCHTPRFNMLY